jgi:5-formaminoimidazole-4-carboxamide-1-(beta)-D-ribofuranosyl 5'-monophosphate synthetase
LSLAVASVASHSALDVFDGAKDEGLRTIAICRKGRERIYTACRETIDRCLVLSDYKEMVSPEIQERLIEDNSVIVPNRSMAVYVGYTPIERDLRVPVFGNKFLLRWEERTGDKNYYRLLDEARVRRPASWRVEEARTDTPLILKIQESGRPQERAFIIASNKDDLYSKISDALRRGIIEEEQLRGAVAEELVLGARFNINYFYSVARGAARDIEHRSQDPEQPRRASTPAREAPAPARAAGQHGGGWAHARHAPRKPAGRGLQYG